MCSSLPPLKHTFYNKCIEVDQQGYGFTSLYDKNPFISTFGLGPCIALVGYNREYKIGFIYHMDNKNCFQDRNVAQLYYKISTMKKKLDIENMMFEVTLFGATTQERQDFIDYIYSQLQKYNALWKKSHNIEVCIVQNYIGTPNNSTSVCLNTKDGSLYSFNGKKSKIFKNKGSLEIKVREMNMLINSMSKNINLTENYFGKIVP